MKVWKIQTRKFWASSVEWKYIYQLTNSVSEGVIRDYVANQIAWHVIKANRYRFYEYTIKLLAIVMPTLVVIAQQLWAEENSVIQAVVLGAATITSTSGAFLKLHDKRVLYRKTAERLKEETILYVAHAGQYRNEDRDEYFVTEFAKIVNDTNFKWEKIEEKEGSKPDKESVKHTEEQE